MSGLLLTFGRKPSSCVIDQLKFTDTTQFETIDVKPWQGVTTRVDHLHRWGMAHDPVTNVHVLLLGRIAFSGAEWESAKHLPYTGGLACRQILHHWLHQPKEIEYWLNGAGCVVILDPRNDELHVITDRMGMLPLYQSNGQDFVLCSHPDVLYDALIVDQKPQYDWLTMAEFIATGYSVQPYTYYDNITQLDAGRHYVWQSGEHQVVLSENQAYWHPAYIDQIDDQVSIDELAEDLGAAFKQAIKIRHVGDKTGVFISGGADSRTMLFAAENPQNVECITFFDEPNKELETAAKLVKIAGATHHQWQREFDFYGHAAQDIVRISGGMWSLINSHYIGFLNKLNQLNLETVLTGCYADYMFKGIAFNRQYRTLFGKALPLYDLSEFQYYFYQPVAALESNWEKKVSQRLQHYFHDFEVGVLPNDPLALEERRLRPICREADASGRMALWRTMPFDSAFADSDVLAVYGRLPWQYKLNGLVFEKAVAYVVGEAGKSIVNNNYGTQLGISEQVRILQFLRGVIQRKIQYLTQGKQRAKKGIATAGSWPEWSYYITNSIVIKHLWENYTPIEKDFFTDMLGYNPWQTPIEVWGQQRDPLLFFRLLTLKLWLAQRKVL